jgi:hypothetical protein
VTSAPCLCGRASHSHEWVFPAINLDQGSSVPLGFVFELTNEFSPSHITHSFGKLGILDHVLVANTLTCREGDHRFDAKIKPNHFRGDRFRLDIVFYQDGDEIAVGTIFGDGHRTGLTAVLQH